jgi:general secretion pathway protein E/type IV pilus assembly protein PilB
MTVLDTLLQKSLITAEQRTQAIETARAKGVRAERAIVELGLASEEDVLDAMSQVLGIDRVDVAHAQVDRAVLALLPSKVVFRKRVVPVARENGTLTVATSDPLDLYGLDEVRLLTGLEVRPALASEEEITKFIKTHYGVGGDTLDQMVGAEDALALDGLTVTGKAGGAGGEGESAELVEAAQDASVVKLVNEIFLEALNERASDIHIEPYEHDLKVRYRIDGVLHEAQVPATIRRFQGAILSRIKIMANLNIAEKRLPQDGRIKFTHSGRQVDVRVSVIPMLFGEGVVMRVLDRAQVLFTLPQLGMAEDTFGLFKTMIDRPHGMILVTGPTGAGKTTTLYAALQAIVSPEIKVLTVEDPVEYHLDGVNQIQVQPKIEFTFARGLRAILRHDPDVVMIGEIRDLETAEAAIQASLTGHLVLSTLHTNDACSAATRLMDMGVEPFLVTSTLMGAMAQRLLRTICSACKEEYSPDRAELPSDFVLEPGASLWRGKGCKRCRGTGYKGRTGLYELVEINDPIRDKVMARSSASDIVRTARTTAGLRLLREDGWTKVRAGITTPEEVVRSTNM